MYTTLYNVCYWTCYKSYVTLNILTTVKYYDELLMFAKYGCSRYEKSKKQNLKRYDRRENAVCAPWTCCSNFLHAVEAS